MSFKWGDFETIIMEGPVKNRPGVYQNETPWLCVENDSLVIVVPWENDKENYFQIGVKITDIVKSYIDVLKEEGEAGENKSDDILVAIRDLSEIIKLLSEAQTVKKPEMIL